jgi:hypothetical protein
MNDSISSRTVPGSGYCRRVQTGLSVDLAALSLVTIVAPEDPWVSSFWV